MFCLMMFVLFLLAVGCLLVCCVDVFGLLARLLIVSIFFAGFWCLFLCFVGRQVVDCLLWSAWCFAGFGERVLGECC